VNWQSKVAAALGTFLVFAICSSRAGYAAQPNQACLLQVVEQF
jgi:hypothetical protein